MLPQKKVIVIGSGLAGLTSAFRAQEAGYAVTIIEKHKEVGGRTANFQTKTMEVESGLHAFFGFYDNLIRLIRDAGLKLEDIVEWNSDLYVYRPGYKTAKFTFAPIYQPFSTLINALGNSQLYSWREKLQIIKLNFYGLKDYLFNADSLDQITIEAYAHKHKLSKQLIKSYLEMLSEGIYFLKPDSQSAYVFFSIFFSHLHNIYKARVGSFKGGMTEVMTGPIAEDLRTKGVAIYLETEVKELTVKSGKVIGVKTQNQQILADVVILATDINSAKKLLIPKFLKQDFVKNLDQLGTTSTVNMQINLTEPILNTSSTNFTIDTNIGTFAEQAHSTFPKQPGRISLIFKNTEQLISKKKQELLEIVLTDFQKLGFDLKDKVKAYDTVTWEAEFYSMRPGSEKLRPSQETDIPGLILAGDYTKQKYGSTMEGACYSGELAAKALKTLNIDHK